MNNTRPFDRREAFEIFLTFDGAGFSTEHAIERSIEAAQQFNAAVEAAGGVERLSPPLGRGVYVGEVDSFRLPVVKSLESYGEFYARNCELRILMSDGGTVLFKVFATPEQAMGMAIALNSIGEGDD